jgi:hypothetical protein
MKIIRLGIMLLLAFAVASCASRPHTQCCRPLPPTVSVPCFPDSPPVAAVTILTISAKVDGSGRMVFTDHEARYEHLNWSPPTHVLVDGQPWEPLDKAFADWPRISDGLDLSRAWIVKRAGRDVVALESTPNGFDLYLADSPNGSADYSITIAIPRRN